ncbi:MAG: molecular chaperone DnaK [Rickettsiales bacterium]|nr:molecular chaperone DnaK [Rickettsiales bacterium]
MAAIIGIDLGTTNSCVAVVRNGRPQVLEDDRGYNILPSCVATSGKGRFLVGHGAKALVLNHPKNTLYSVKRLLGRKFSSDEVQEASRHLSFDILADDHGDVVLRMGEVEVTPVEVSSIILKAVKEIAEKNLNETIVDAVITVPANFSHQQRQDTMEAGKKAGLNVLRLINEPTAAALAFGFKKDIDKKIAIFDLGGGTFDVSVVEAAEGVYEILATAGNTFLGGEDFDYRIVDWLVEQFMAAGGADPREDLGALQRLKDAAEKAKCELSFVDRTPVLIPRLQGSKNLEVELRREQLEELVQDLVNETIRITDEALREAGIKTEELDEIILVGGMTRMPKIQETIRVYFGKNPCKGVHPEEVVAIGAAVHGSFLGEGGGEDSDAPLLLDVTPFSLGMDVAGGYCRPIIKRNTTVPCSETRTFTTVVDNQEQVQVIVRQGESNIADDNEFLGEFTLQGIREALSHEPKIDVTFKVDGNAILHVSAMDRDTGESHEISIREFVREDDVKAVTLTEGDGPQPASAASSAPPPSDDKSEGSGLLGKLAKMARRGSADEHAVAERDEAAAKAAMEAAEREPKAPEPTAEVPASEPLVADEHAVAERDEEAAARALAANMEDTAEIPTLSHADIYDIAPKESSSPFGSGLNVSDDLDLANNGLDDLDPFGIAPKAEESSGVAAGAAIVHSTPLEQEQAPAAPAPEPARPKKRPARLRISYKQTATFVKEYQRNLKRGGTFVKTKKPLEVGRSCILHLTIPGVEEPIEIRGAVVWSSRDAEDVEGKDQGMGIKYASGDDSGLKRLREVLNTLEGEATS